MTRVIVVVGPTASGKTDLSIALARHYNAPILSTDSRQVYKGLPIGTAYPSQEQLDMVEHHFIGELELTEEFNCGEYEKCALERLELLFQKHNTVVAVGGSGLYIQALCEGMDALTLEEKERCLSFAEAINAIEGLTISTELEQQLEKWKNGEMTFHQVFEDALRKYGFPI